MISGKESKTSSIPGRNCRNDRVQDAAQRAGAYHNFSKFVTNPFSPKATMSKFTTLSSKNKAASCGLADADETFVCSYEESETGFRTPSPSSPSTKEGGSTTVDRFSRSELDKAFGSGTSSQGFTKHGKKTGEVVASSPAVKADLVKVRADGHVDQRCAAVKKGLVVVDEDGAVSKAESILCKEQISFTGTGKVSQTSAAVKDGLVRLKTNGQVDRRSSLVKQGWLKLNEEGAVDCKESALCQRLYLKETNGAHIHSFEVADKITQRKEAFPVPFVHVLVALGSYRAILDSMQWVVSCTRKAPWTGWSRPSTRTATCS
jgi:hypothetical protein